MIKILPLLFLFPLTLWAFPDCRTSLGDISTGGTHNCNNVYIDTAITIGANAQPVIINADEEVIIAANITLNGQNGSNIPGGDAPGGVGGPGAGDGGGRAFGTIQDGQDVLYPGSITNGKTISNLAFLCASGGSGAGFYQRTGSNGLPCTAAGSPVPTGGQPTIAGEFDFTIALFRGGFGGGAGDIASGDEFGAGGGGGGGLYINATRNIRVQPGVTISARGGTGGSALLGTDSDGAGGVNNGGGGGGGGGSGGAVWLKTAGIIINLGTINVNGGAGGRNTLTGGHGGNGADGVYRLESSTGTITGFGTRLPTVTAAKSLKSDISCGTIKTDNKNIAAQMSLGFGIVILLSLLMQWRPLRRARIKISPKRLISRKIV